MAAPAAYRLIPSQIDDAKSLREQAVRLDLPNHEGALKRFDIQSIQAFQKAANYLAVAQIYLIDNVLIHKSLDYQSDVKKRLLGHFGTVPGLVFAYTHATALLSRVESSVGCGHEQQQSRGIFITGPGHGAPAILACLYLEGSISRFYPEEAMSEKGLQTFVKNFSWPNTVHPSHVTATTPGAIHEGGELGYALSVAYGAVMDKPDLIAFAIIGDGEAETGPTATAWHAHKFIDPVESGAVLPILHLNRFKISEKTIFGTMDKTELTALFTGYGYQVRFVDYYEHLGDKHTIPGDEHVAAFDIDMAVTLDWAHSQIRTIQRAARSGKPILKPRWPMIILSSPKGWGCPQEVEGQTLEGTFRSHQVPIKVDPSAGDGTHLRILESWLQSYSPKRWFTVESGALRLSHEIKRILPKNKELLMGQVKEIYERSADLVDVGTHKFMVDSESPDKPATASSMSVCGKYLAELMSKNVNNLMIVCPDELVSNHLDATLDVKKFRLRNFQADADTLLTPEDRQEGVHSGRVIEMLSEHTLQGFCQGYSLTGRISLFPSYESFLGIVATMIEQYAKFLKAARTTSFRPPVPSITYVMTSTLWRQEHNGDSHQNPGLINTMLNLPHNVARVYLPPDVNCTLSTLSHCLRSRNYANLIVASKHATRVYLSADEANQHCKAGASIWNNYSTEGGRNPDVVLVGIGVETTAEVISASELLRGINKDKDNDNESSGLRVRVVNITDLMILSEGSSHPHALSEEMFEALFTNEKPIVVSFHGYPSAVKGLLGDRLARKFGRRPTSILGFVEEGTTTTPWSMLKVNGVDRFTVACKAMELVDQDAKLIEERGHRANDRIAKLISTQHFNKLGQRFQQRRREWEVFISENGYDPPEASE